MAKTKKRKPNTPYRLPKTLGSKPDKLVLAMDPGSRNFGIALVGLEGKKVKCYANSVLMRPVNDLVRFGDAVRPFLGEINGWMGFEPNGLIAERFQTRGNGGPLIEQVSCMLGLIAGYWPRTPIKLTIASAWKNSMHRRFADQFRGTDYCNEKGEFDLRAVYKQIAVQPHQLDAALIGVYGLEQGLGIDIEFNFDAFVSQVERTSLIPIRKRKLK